MDNIAPQHPTRPPQIVIATLLCVSWAIASLVDHALFAWREGADSELIWLLILFFPLVFSGLIWQGVSTGRFLMAFWISFWMALPFAAIRAAGVQIPWVEIGKLFLFGLWPMVFFGIPAVLFAFLPDSSRYFKLCKAARGNGVVVA
jgi:hypothetical protein